jgi:3-ketosteroid 9alpha-monooxygenase subunit B
MTERDAVVRRHRYHALRVKRVVRETEEARSFVLDVPADLRDMFDYGPGQFCSVRVHIGSDEHSRCYSMSSAPETDSDLTVTVKRVPGGVVSNWLIDHLSEGDLVEVTRPSGNFCVREGQRPLIAFCGGSGITPVISIAKSVLTASSRSVRLLYANRDAASVIFHDHLDTFQGLYLGRFDVRHHLDLHRGFLDRAAIVAFVDGCVDADFYICGPGPFMDLVEATLLELGVKPDAIAIERFVAAADSETLSPTDTEVDRAPEAIVLILRGKKYEIGYHAGDTVLETARRANVLAPYSCEAGNCATCMALVQEGTVTMRVNDALTAEEVGEGWVLTCQARPTSPSLTVEYEPL